MKSTLIISKRIKMQMYNQIILTSGAIQIVLGVLLIYDNRQIGYIIILLGLVCRIIGRLNKLYEIFQYKKWKDGRTIRRDY